jgi:hypothetical protein
MCTKQFIVKYNYDYNINSHFEKCDTLLLDFLIIYHTSLVNIPIKLTYACRLLNKNLICNTSCLVNYLIKHNKLSASSMFKCTYNELPY